MRIAVLSTVYKATPPIGYGGIERVVHTFTEGLIKAGHDVTLFGAAGSHCSGRTIELRNYDPANAPSGITSKRDIISEETLYEAVAAEHAREKFDLIHDWSFSNLFVTRHPERAPFVISTCIPPAPGYTRPNLVACSAAHARQIGGATRFVHYGLNLADWPHGVAKTNDLVHISKIARYKAQHEAINAARRAGRPIIVAGNIESKFYYWTRVRPALLRAGRRACYIGEVRDTGAVLRPAAALVQTPRWFDAFPLIVLESLASGTPVIAYATGGLPEQIVDGLTGYLCRDESELSARMGDIDRLRPADCRAYAEEHFAVANMVQNYEALYAEARDGKSW